MPISNQARPLRKLLATLAGKKGLVVGVANEHSIAYGCARANRDLGDSLAVTYQNERANPHPQRQQDDKDPK